MQQATEWLAAMLVVVSAHSVGACRGPIPDSEIGVSNLLRGPERTLDGF